MLSNARSVGAFLRNGALVLLALSVFWFGLHSRLETYKSTASSVTDSKLSTEKHSTEVLKALERHDRPSDDLPALILDCFLRTASPTVSTPLAQLASIELGDPRRLDLGGVYSLHGPPATTL